MESIMEAKLVSNNQMAETSKLKIIQLCFDAKSIEKFTPGLKMLYALDDPPLFVLLEKKKQRFGG